MSSKGSSGGGGGIPHPEHPIPFVEWLDDEAKFQVNADAAAYLSSLKGPVAGVWLRAHPCVCMCLYMVGGACDPWLRPGSDRCGRQVSHGQKLPAQPSFRPNRRVRGACCGAWVCGPPSHDSGDGSLRLGRPSKLVPKAFGFGARRNRWRGAT